MRRHTIEAALARWRAAERALIAADADAGALQAEADAARAEFHDLAAEHMASQIDEERERQRAPTKATRAADNARQASRHA